MFYVSFILGQFITAGFYKFNHILLIVTIFYTPFGDHCHQVKKKNWGDGVLKL